MRLLLFFAMLMLPAIAGRCQGMFGAEAGIAQATAKKSVVTPTIKGYYLHKFTRTIYWGGTFSYERYSFSNSYNVPPSAGNNGAAVSIRQKSGYTYMSPTIDLGLGYRKYLHVHASFGLGILTNGRQLTNRDVQYIGTPPVGSAFDTVTYNTTQNIPILASRYAMGFSWRIPTGAYWNVMLTSEYAHIPNNLTNLNPPLKTDCVTFTVGIMHKYPRVFVEY